MTAVNMMAGEPVPIESSAPQINPELSIADEAAEWDTLATALNRWGVLHVAPARPNRVGIPETATELFERLLSSAEPRLQQAVIPLLITHPTLTGDAQSAIARLEGAQHDRAMRRFVAAAALQRMARTRLALSLGAQPLLPSYYLEELELPSLDEDFGRATLLALAEQERDRYGYDAWGTYRTLLDLLLSEIRRRGWGVQCDN